MIWTRSETLALAKQRCVYCFGLGLRPTFGGRSAPCNCVLRTIFRRCFERFERCVSAEGYLSRVGPNNLLTDSGRPRAHQALSYGFKKQEYAADFVLVARRTLGEDTLAYKIFKFHFLLGADWKLCTRRLGIERGCFFHEVYRIEQRLGRAFREMRPHALFPTAEYFGVARRTA